MATGNTLARVSHLHKKTALSKPVLTLPKLAVKTGFDTAKTGFGNAHTSYQQVPLSSTLCLSPKDDVCIPEISNTTKGIVT